MSYMSRAKVLHVFGNLNRGGAETLIVNLFRAVDKEKLQFDFVVHSEIPGHYEAEITALGGKIFCMPRYTLLNTMTYMKAWRIFLRTNTDYRAVHIHVSNFAFIILKVLDQSLIPIRIVHAHSESDSNLFKRALVWLFRDYVFRGATHRFAVSKKAGFFVFGRERQVAVVPNAVDTARFQFDLRKRDQVRQSLSVGSNLVVGHVGRFVSLKNHAFLIEIFTALSRIRPDAVLLLVGDGPLRQKFESAARKENLNVQFLGLRNDVEALMQGMDVFCLPSLYEGLPVSVVEAQATGLPCLLSDAISKEAAIVPSIVRFLSLKRRSKKWAETIMELAKLPRKDHSRGVGSAGFDINEQARWYEMLYAPQSDEKVKAPIASVSLRDDIKERLSEYLITVFTPAYNRAYILGELYRSLCANNFSSFEWVIVDDGSTDNTEPLVRGWIEAGEIDITYFRRANGGKHRAINDGVRLARGELFFIVDSDDFVAVNSLFYIAKSWQDIQYDRKCAGVAGLRIDPNGKIIGTTFPQECLDANAIEFRYDMKVQGDKAEVFRTSVLREFPFPEIHGEKFLTEAVVWNRIAEQYFIRWINCPLIVCEYRSDGLSHSLPRLFRENPKGFNLYYWELLWNKKLKVKHRIVVLLKYFYRKIFGFKFDALLRRK